MYFFAPFLFLLSLIPAILFYKFHNEWEWSTSIYFSVQVLFGELFGVPNEPTRSSQYFTLGFFLWGALLTAGAIGSFSAHVVYNTIKEVRRKSRYVALEEVDDDGIITYYDYFKYWWHNLSAYLRWNENRLKYLTILACLCWTLFGIMYGVIYERIDFSSAIYLAVGVISCAGIPAPLCEGDTTSCELGIIRAWFYTIYIMVGVPLFTFTLGQLAGFVAESAIHSTEARILVRPLNEEEFRNAISLCRRPNERSDRVHSIAPFSSSSLDSKFDPYQSGKDLKIHLAEFLVLELLRLKRIDEEDVQEICSLFHHLDDDGSGYINRMKLRRRSLMMASNSWSFSLSNSALPAVKEVEMSASSVEKDGLKSPYVPSLESSQDRTTNMASLLPSSRSHTNTTTSTTTIAAATSSSTTTTSMIYDDDSKVPNEETTHLLESNLKKSGSKSDKSNNKSSSEYSFLSHGKDTGWLEDYNSVIRMYQKGGRHRAMSVIIPRSYQRDRNTSINTSFV